MLHALQLVVGVAAATPLRPKHAVNLTLFHVNPLKYSPEPVNMNTGDALGDMYFDLRSVGIPLECAHPSASTAHDCSNAEVTGSDLVITKLVIEADQRWGGYARCNICINGTDHHADNNCTNDKYVCACGDDFKHPERCNASVGRSNISQRYGSDRCVVGMPAWECWRQAVAAKTGGLWFSTMDGGHCGDANASDCTWRTVQIVKRVNKTCSDNSIFTTVERFDAEDGTGCFKNCTGGVGPGRNTSDLCWIGCFYATALGPDAGVPGGKVAGMPLADLREAWEAPFQSDDPARLGCPHIRHPGDPSPGPAQTPLTIAV
eukprot:TRINITY_DN28216_c0_g1_i1.p1 TRINITY_DN28216_c0_g1~~TRINITY_DN28216_c0_g1_i1.p1  ORF type:complete len:318 (+),score=26.51 TRINITY_DN28216_c0_g1_i1:34-987(+)